MNNPFKIDNRTVSIETVTDLIGHLTNLREDAGNILKQNAELVEKIDETLFIILDEFQNLPHQKISK